MAVSEEAHGAGLERVAIAESMAQAKAKPGGPQLRTRTAWRGPMRSMGILAS